MLTGMARLRLRLGLRGIGWRGNLSMAASFGWLRERILTDIGFSSILPCWCLAEVAMVDYCILHI